MKKVILLAAGFIFCISMLHAQINKGSVLLGGGINFTHAKEESNSNIKSNGIALNPAFGLTVRQNTVIGIQVLYGHSKNNFTTSPGYESQAYGFELFLRKYKPLGKGFYLFGQTGLFYNNNDFTYLYPTYKNKQELRSFGADLYPGISYAITKKFHLEASLANLVTLKYSKDKITSAGVVTQDRNGVDFNVNASSFSSINIGFRVFFSK